MPPSRQRQWYAHSQQQALLEYGSLIYACPEGIYMSLIPGNFTLWTGVFFVRTGLYAPAVLRFQVSFPPRYPRLPPLVTFTSDIFHPLVTPLTTYTYTTGSSGSDTVSATDEERLVPGGFSLRHRFPSWFERDSKKPSIPRDRKFTQNEGEDIEGDSDEHELLPRLRVGSVRSDTLQSDTPLTIDLLHKQTPEYFPPSVIEVLRYVKKSFEDEDLLDELPLNAAGNPGAWHAWKSYRKKGARAKDPPTTPRKEKFDRPAMTSPSRGFDAAGRLKPPGDWNWDGVWAERVKKGVSASISEQMLYGGTEGDDTIHFLDLDEDTIEAIRDSTTKMAEM